MHLRRVLTVILLGIVLPFATGLPAQAGALTVDELQAQIADLLAQVGQLQEQLKSTQVLIPSTYALCPQLGRVLSRGAEGDDVSSLQTYLGVQKTGYFGAVTERAVQKLQEKVGLMPANSVAAGGYGVVGPRTRAAIYAACGSSVQGGAMSTNDMLSVSVRGLAISSTVTVNAKSSCAAQQYVLDFGDGTPSPVIPIAANTCHAIQKTFVHTYATSGPYTVMLTSGSEKISIPLSVKGSALQTAGTMQPCIAPTFLSRTIPVARIGSNWTLPVFSASTTSDGISITADGLPPGVTLRSQTAASVGTSTMWILDGVPSVSGTYSLTLTAMNYCGTAIRTISLPVNTL